MFFIILLLISFFYETVAAPSDEKELAVAVGINPEGRRLTYQERQLALSQVRKSRGKIVSVDLFSKSDVVHNQWGVRGEGTTALLLEDTGICPRLFRLAGDQFTELNNRYEYAKYLNVAAATEVILNPVNFSHGTVVAHTAHQIAPGSALCVLPKSNSKTFTSEMIPEQFRREATVINVSSDPLELLFMNDRLFPELIFSDPDNPKLVVFAAGNSGTNYMFDGFKPHLMEHKDIWPHSIFCIAIDSDNCTEDYSGIPGQLEEFQKKSICALGRSWSLSIESLESKAPFSFRDLKQYQGTSYSAPIVTAAVLLLENYIKKEFNISLSDSVAQEILFNSARRTFISTTHQLGFKMTMFYYDPKDQKYNLAPHEIEEMSGVYRKKYDFYVNKFDPSCYGEGILDLESAFRYTVIKFSHPDWSPERVRQAMLDLNEKRDHRAATIIKRAFQEYKSRKAIHFESHRVMDSITAAVNQHLGLPALEEGNHL